MTTLDCPERRPPRRLAPTFDPDRMQRKRAAALRAEWGDRPCDHPTLAKEYDEGVRTGNYVCTQCGAAITFRERAELLAKRRGGAGDREAE